MAYTPGKDTSAGYISPDHQIMLQRLQVAQKRTKRATLEFLIEQAAKKL